MRKYDRISNIKESQPQLEFKANSELTEVISGDRIQTALQNQTESFVY